MPEKWEGVAEDSLRRICQDQKQEIKKLRGTVKARTSERNKLRKEIDEIRKMEGVLKLPILKTA